MTLSPSRGWGVEEEGPEREAEGGRLPRHWASSVESATEEEADASVAVKYSSASSLLPSRDNDALL